MSTPTLTSNLKKTFGLTNEELADGRIATVEDIGSRSTKPDRTKKQQQSGMGHDDGGKMGAMRMQQMCVVCATPVLAPPAVGGGWRQIAGAPAPGRPHGFSCTHAFVTPIPACSRVHD
jgi:hypothetical protein